MAIYTKRGDEGKTDLGNGVRIEKSALRVEAYGTLDELIACLGLIRVEVREGHQYAQTNESNSKATIGVLLGNLDGRILEIQRQLSALAGWVATPESELPESIAGEEALTRLEREIDELMEAAGPWKGFVMPGKNVLEASLHLARTVCRRSERCLVRLFLADELSQEAPQKSMSRNASRDVRQALAHVNRLSDWLFAISRVV